MNITPNLDVKVWLGADAIGMVKAGTAIEVTGEADNGLTVAPSVGGTKLAAPKTLTVAFQPRPHPFQVGFHLLSEARHGDGYLKPAGVYPDALGCQSYVVYGGVRGAVELAQRTDKFVIYRPSTPERGYMPDVNRVIDECRLAIERGIAVTTGINECDQMGGGCGATATKIIERARWEKDFIAKARAINPNVVIVAGEWSYGTPDFTNEDVCRAIKAEYKPLHDSGIKIGIHSYSPDPAHIDKPDELKWFERRFEWFFTRCGFDPAKRGIYIVEAGIDQGGTGGAKALGMSPAEYGAFLVKYFDAISKPIVVNGIQHTTPVEQVILFQYGCGLAGCSENKEGNWFGYQHDYALPEVAKAARWYKP